MKLILLSLLILTSCAQLHKGKFAKQVNPQGQGLDKSETKKKERFNPYNGGNKSYRRNKSKTDSGMLVSYGWNRTYQDRHFRYLEFTFENTSKDWKKIEKVGVKFGKEADSGNIFFLKRAPLSSFLKAKNLAIQIQKKNDAMLAGALAGIAASANASSSNNYNNFNSGLISMAVAGSIAKGSKNVNEFPEEHLFGSKEKFLIPPGMAITKYLVFYTKESEKFNTLKNLYVSYQMKDQKKEQILLDVSSRW